MSYFYRLSNVIDHAGESDFIWKGSYRPSGKDGLLPIVWTKAMKEIPLDPPWPHCKVLRASLFPQGYEQEYHMFQLKPEAQIPDIFCTKERALVSAKAKAVLETCDDFEHEYIETEIQDLNRQRINQEPYYLFSVRRFLKIDGLEGEQQVTEKTFFPRPQERHFLPTLHKSPELIEKVSQLPLWRHRLDESVIYMSATVLDVLLASGLTGLKNYSHKSGEPGESIVRVDA